MILWKESLDKFVITLPVVSSSFLPLLYQPPDSPPSLHIALYLPTSGKEAEFIEEITKLRNFLENILDENPDYIVFIRGDSNVNIKNRPRYNIFEDFINRFKLLISILVIGHTIIFLEEACSIQLLMLFSATTTRVLRRSSMFTANTTIHSSVLIMMQSSPLTFCPVYQLLLLQDQKLQLYRIQGQRFFGMKNPFLDIKQYLEAILKH